VSHNPCMVRQVHGKAQLDSVISMPRCLQVLAALGTCTNLCSTTCGRGAPCPWLLISGQVESEEQGGEGEVLRMAPT
jgi:hypothetical protein